MNCTAVNNMTDAEALSARMGQEFAIPIQGIGSVVAAGARGATRSTASLLAAGNRAIDESGLSRAAQKLTSHAQRSGGTFPEMTGNVASRNAQAESVLRNMLESPAAVRTSLSRGGLEIRLPNGQGARWDADGSFSGFLDPRN
jgi:filamentous hemagglutinin